jgi:hypothetical protein
MGKNQDPGYATLGNVMYVEPDLKSPESWRNCFISSDFPPRMSDIRVDSWPFRAWKMQNSVSKKIKEGQRTGCLLLSVADPGCLSRIPDPDFYPSRIPDLGSRIQKQQPKREVKKTSCHIFLCGHKYQF